MKRAAGFTLVELIVVMILLGILAAVAIPRMTGLSDYRALEFRDSTVAALRYGQKTATSHRRMVCVVFTDTKITLTIDHDKTGACDDIALNLPGSSANFLDTTSTVFNPVPPDLFVQSDGRITTDAAGTVIAPDKLYIDGQTDIDVQGATGYVQ